MWWIKMMSFYLSAFRPDLLYCHIRAEEKVLEIAREGKELWSEG